MGAERDAIKDHPHSSHWGAFRASWRDDALVVTPHPNDPDPNGLIQNLPTALRHRARIARPMVRRGWLEGGPGPTSRRGRDSFVAMEWDEVLDLARRANSAGCATRMAPGAIFGGSYGWSSAGRFHHAQSQVHRFLNTALGGYVRSVNSYSAGRVGGDPAPCPRPATTPSPRTASPGTRSSSTPSSCVAFGGMALKNSMVGERRRQPAIRARRDARGACARLRVPTGQPAARRPAR